MAIYGHIRTADISVRKAAARPPLLKMQYPADFAFDLDTFMPILLEEGLPQGQG